MDDELYVRSAREASCIQRHASPYGPPIIDNSHVPFAFHGNGPHELQIRIADDSGPNKVLNLIGESMRRAVQKCVSDESVRCSIGRGNDYWDMVCLRMVQELVAFQIPDESDVEIDRQWVQTTQVPKTWWDAWKQAHANNWLLRFCKPPEFLRIPTLLETKITHKRYNVYPVQRS